MLLLVQRLSDTQVIGVVQGGYDVNERRRSAEETAKRSVAGTSSLFLLQVCSHPSRPHLKVNRVFCFGIKSDVECSSGVILVFGRIHFNGDRFWPKPNGFGSE